VPRITRRDRTEEIAGRKTERVVIWRGLPVHGWLASGGLSYPLPHRERVRMADPKRHYHIDFAARYARTHFPTLNAFSSIWRIESLIEDTKMLDELRDLAGAKEIRFGNRLRTYEIVDYFRVGFVTCLEWHARSRIVDLLAFAPACIETNDVKTIDKVALSQMAAANVTLPHIVGATTRISSIQDYLSIFERVFAALEIKSKPEALLRSTYGNGTTATPEDPHSLYDVIDRMFASRNHLVNEIDIAVIGSYQTRDFWTPSEARRAGEATLRCVKLMETEITNHAPSKFPNKLDPNGDPESELARLKSEIASLENELSTKISSDSDFNPSGWQEALDASKASMEKETCYIRETRVFGPTRYLNIKASVEHELLRSRLSYLATLKRETE
jgi:hypothetical protein